MGCPNGVGIALGARSMRMRVASSTANVGLCSMYICWCVCMSM